MTKPEGKTAMRLRKAVSWHQTRTGKLGAEKPCMQASLDTSGIIYPLSNAQVILNAQRQREKKSPIALALCIT
jgi:hypothetical protein